MSKKNEHKNSKFQLDQQNKESTMKNKEITGTKYKRIERLNVLVVGNGFNVEFLTNGDKYSDIFSKSSHALREKALEADLLRPVHDNDNDNDKNHAWELYGNTVKLKLEPTKDEKKYWNYLTTKREWDAETLASILLLSKTFQEEDETFAKMLREGIIKDIAETYEREELFNVMWKHEYRKLLLEKLNAYDYIITTNYDSNLTELVRDRSKIIQLTGTIKYADRIHLSPFTSRPEFDAKLIQINKNTKRGYVDFDIFGINMTKQLLLLEFIFSKTNRHTHINHYIYNLNKRKLNEDLFQIVKEFSPAEFAQDHTIGERFKELKLRVYAQIDHSEWVGRNVKNSIFSAAFPTFEELFETLRKNK